MERTEYIDSLVQRIGTNFPARYTERQKQAFRAFLLQELAQLGWGAEIVTDGHLFKSRNVITKNSRADVLILAHYDTIGYDLLSGSLSRIFGSSLFGQLVSGTIVGLILVRLGGWLQGALAASLPQLLIWLLELAIPLLIFAPLFIPNKNCLNDNTSGVIALLNIARSLNAHPELKQRVRLAFVDLEEVGLFGSRHLRRHLLKSGVDLCQMMIINFDCVGWGQVPVVCAAGKGTKAQQLFRHLRVSRPDVVLSKMPSDHLSFRREGAVGVLFGSPSLLGRSYYVPNAHSPRDVHLEPEKISWLTREIVSFLRE